MRHYFLLLATSFIFQLSVNATVVATSDSANSVISGEGKKTVQLNSQKQKLTLKQKLQLLLIKKQIRKNQQNLLSAKDNADAKFKWGGFWWAFLAGLVGTIILPIFGTVIFGLLGVGYVHFIKKNTTKGHKNASWVGFLSLFLLIAIIGVVALASIFPD
jgi:hypothetical protein